MSRLLSGLAGHDGRPAVAAAQDAGRGVEEQAAALLLGLVGVALVAALDQQRADLLLEEFHVRRPQLCRGSRATGREQEKDCQASHSGRLLGRAINRIGNYPH